MSTVLYSYVGPFLKILTKTDDEKRLTDEQSDYLSYCDVNVAKTSAYIPNRKINGIPNRAIFDSGIIEFANIDQVKEIDLFRRFLLDNDIDTEKDFNDATFHWGVVSYYS